MSKVRTRATKCRLGIKSNKMELMLFGENMPENFFKLPRKDFKDCDLLIIMGTSLEVQPFASLIDKAGPKCMRLLINRDKVGVEKSWFSIGPGLKLDKEDNTRDVAYIGNCDDGVYALANALGWGDELRELVKSEHARLGKEKITDVLVEKEDDKVPAESKQDTSEAGSTSKLHADAK